MNRAIPLEVVQQAVSVVVETIVNELVSDRPVTVRHFGTLSPCTIAGHRAHNVSTGQVTSFPSVRIVKFHPHASLLLLLSRRRKRFEANSEKDALPNKSTSNP